LTNDPKFLLSCRISQIGKGPLVHTFTWGYKRNQEVFKAQEDASKMGLAYLGPTLLSDFVAFKAADFRKEMVDLVDDSEHDAFKTIEELLRMLPPDDFELYQCEANALIIELMYESIANWDLRQMDDVARFPLRFLLLLESPPEETSALRKEIASALLALEDCCLTDTHSNIALVFKRAFLEDFKLMEIAGQCTLCLYGALLAFRSRLPSDSREVEGSLRLTTPYVEMGATSSDNSSSDNNNS